MDWKNDPRRIPEMEFVQEHLSTAADYVATKFRQHTTRFMQSFPVQSPIEAVFYGWWSALMQTREINENEFYLARQHEVQAGGRPCRLDFAVLADPEWIERAKLYDMAVPQIAVECDGHEWHERTREQVSERNERDRRLQADGWLVLHFSGSELNKNPRQCVIEVFVQARDAYRRFEDAMSERDVDEAFGGRDGNQN